MLLAVFNQEFDLIYSREAEFESSLKIASNSEGEVTASFESVFNSELAYLRSEATPDNQLVLFISADSRRTGGLIKDIAFSYDSDVVSVNITSFDPLGSVLSSVVTSYDPTRPRENAVRVNDLQMDAANGTIGYFGACLTQSYVGPASVGNSWHTSWTQSRADILFGTPVYMDIPEFSPGYIPREIMVPRVTSKLSEAMGDLFAQVPELSMHAEIVIPDDNHEKLPSGGFYIKPIVSASTGQPVMPDYDSDKKADFTDKLKILLTNLENENSPIEFADIPTNSIVYNHDNTYTVEEVITPRVAGRIVFGGSSYTVGEGSDEYTEEYTNVWGSLDLDKGYVTRPEYLHKSGDARWNARNKGGLFKSIPEIAGKREIVVDVKDSSPWKPLIDFHPGEMIFLEVPMRKGLYYPMKLSGIEASFGTTSASTFKLTCEKSPYQNVTNMILESINNREARIEELAKGNK